jgi:hypothetical protein
MHTPNRKRISLFSRFRSTDHSPLSRIKGLQSPARWRIVRLHACSVRHRTDMLVPSSIQIRPAVDLPRPRRRVDVDVDVDGVYVYVVVRIGALDASVCKHPCPCGQVRMRVARGLSRPARSQSREPDFSRFTRRSALRATPRASWRRGGRRERRCSPRSRRRRCRPRGRGSSRAGRSCLA